MRIALIGYGNMGKEIERQIRETGVHEIVSIGEQHASDALDTSTLKKADVAIEFTGPARVMENIRAVAALSIPLVVGTTGWYEHLPEVEKLVGKHKTALMYGQNFSIGANIFFRIVGESARLFARFGHYDVFGHEVHHVGKKDSPSGTAKKLASIIIENFPAKKTLQNEKLDRPVRADELHFSSVRGGNNPGLHEIVFDSEADEVRLMHQAHGRQGFARGAIVAAEFIKNKRGLYSFDQLFDSENAV